MNEQYLNNEYRRLLWEKSKELLKKISQVIEIESITVLGSFTTQKERPADVDFIVMVKMKVDENWSTDIQFVPNNHSGLETIKDAKQWMEEKYGKGNFETFELNINDI